LARWLRAQGIEAYVIHPSSVPVSREHRRAKTDRLDTELLKRAFLGWLRGEPKHCSMAAIPTIVHLIAFSARASNIDEMSRPSRATPVALNLEALAVFKPKAKGH
jgi:transposase